MYIGSWPVFFTALAIILRAIVVALRGIRNNKRKLFAFPIRVIKRDNYRKSKQEKKQRKVTKIKQRISRANTLGSNRVSSILLSQYWEKDKSIRI